MTTQEAQCRCAAVYHGRPRRCRDIEIGGKNDEISMVYIFFNQKSSNKMTLSYKILIISPTPFHTKSLSSDDLTVSLCVFLFVCVCLVFMHLSLAVHLISWGWMGWSLISQQQECHVNWIMRESRIFSFGWEMLQWTVHPRLHTWHPLGICQKPNADKSFSHSHTNALLISLHAASQMSCRFLLGGKANKRQH